MNLRERDVALTEVMDDPDCDARTLEASYRRFGLVNRIVSGWGRVWRGTVEPWAAGRDGAVRILDLGCGGGDLLVRLEMLARRARIAVDLTGADPDPRAIAVAAARRGTSARFLRADAGRLLADGERFDLVLSNHVLHHLTAQELSRFAEQSRSLSRGIVLHADIERSAAAYALYAAGIAPLALGTFLRLDGLRSIRRSYRREELQAALGTPWLVDSPAPFRLLAHAAGHA